MRNNPQRDQIAIAIVANREDFIRRRARPSEIGIVDARVFTLAVCGPEAQLVRSFRIRRLAGRAENKASAMETAGSGNSMVCTFFGYRISG